MTFVGTVVDFVRIAIQRLPDSSFRDSRNPILNHLEQAERKAESSDVDGTIKRLVNLRKHLDGCGTQATSDDWVIVCADQILVRELVDLLISNLSR